MKNKKLDITDRKEKLDIIDESIQKIDDAVQELIKDGVSLSEIETYIQLQCSTIISRAFLTHYNLSKGKR